MPGTLLSVRMTTPLAQTFDLVARRVHRRPGEVLEKLLEHPSVRDQLNPVASSEPLTAKRTFRLSPEAYSRLQELVEKHSTLQDRLDVSEVIRRLLVTVFEDHGIWVGADAPAGEEATPEEDASWPVGATGVAGVSGPLWQTEGWVGRLLSVLFLFLMVFLPILAARMPVATPPNPPE